MKTLTHKPWLTLQPRDPNIKQLILTFHNHNNNKSPSRLHPSYIGFYSTSTIYNLTDMALKRINKELTDLGRYVNIHSHTRTQRSRLHASTRSPVNNETLVTLLLRAQQVLSAMIWYVICRH